MEQKYNVRLDVAATGGFWLVNTDRVNLDDLLNAHMRDGHAIVRIDGDGPVDDAIRYMKEDGESVRVVS